MDEVLKKCYSLFAETALEAQQTGLFVTIKKTKDSIVFQVSKQPQDAGVLVSEV